MNDFYKNTDQLDQIDKDPSDDLPYGINCYDFLRGADVYWKRRTFLRPGTTGTPSAGARNAHRYRYSGGVTGETEPAWPTGSGSTVADGNGTWTELGAEDTLSTATWTVPTGLTKGSDSIDASGVVATVGLSSGTLGAAYTVKAYLVSVHGKKWDKSFVVNMVDN